MCLIQWSHDTMGNVFLYHWRRNSHPPLNVLSCPFCALWRSVIHCIVLFVVSSPFFVISLWNSRRALYAGVAPIFSIYGLLISFLFVAMMKSFALFRRVKAVSLTTWHYTDHHLQQSSTPMFHSPSSILPEIVTKMLSWFFITAIKAYIEIQQQSKLDSCTNRRFWTSDLRIVRPSVDQLHYWSFLTID